MESKQSDFFFIDALHLSTSTAKPFHLERRLSEKKRKCVASLLLQVESKREEIIQQRKSKYSARIDYVKEVAQRHRQKQNKVTLEKQKSLDLSLKDAEENRKALLRRRRESCAEIVNGAKEIARNQHLKHRREVIKIKNRLEERFKTTEWRRQQLLKGPRARNPEEVLRQQAVVVIQSWYRKLKFLPVLNDLKKVKLTVDHMSEKSFQQTIRVVQNKTVIKYMARFLGRAKKSIANPPNFKTPARVFLSSFMIVNHTDEIMPEVGPVESELVSAAKAMLEAYDNFAATVPTGQFFNSFSDFVRTWVHYHHTFDAWKSRDTEKVVAGLIGHYIELERMWQNVKDEIHADSEWKPGLKHSQGLVRERLVKIAGDAGLKKLEDALRQEGFPPEDEPSDSVAPVESSETASSPAPTIDDGANLSSSDIDLAALAGQQLTNHMIAHELIVDPNFKLGPPEDDNLTARVRKMAMKAFYDSLRELTNQGNFKWVPDLIMEIKEGIKSLTVEKGRMTTLIDEALDVDLIRQQIEKNVFDLNGCLNTVVQILLQLCAPVRDEAVRAILSSSSTDIPAVFESIMNVIDVMKLDLANFRLEQLRPILKAQAVEYESNKFGQSLSSGETSLTKTTAWLQESFESLAQVSAARNPENIQHPENKLKYEDIYHDAVLSLLFSSTGINSTNIPETLALDAQRMFNLQNEIQGINVVAALIMISRNMLSRDAFATAAPKLREVLFVLIKDSETKLENLSTQVIKTINDTLLASPSSSASTSKSLDASQESFITTMISKTLNTKDKLYSILSRRIQTTIKNHLSSGKFKKDGLSAAGLDVVEKDLEGVSEKVYRLAKHNKEVYREWYDQILRGFVQG